MKKFYTLALAAVVAFGATAAEKSAYSGAKLVRNAELQVATKVEKAEKSLPAARKAAPAKAVAATDITSITGWKYFGLLSTDTGNMEQDVDITLADAATGALEITLANSFKIAGTLDAAMGTVTIANKQYLGKDNYGDDVYFYIKDIDEEGYTVDGASSAASCIGTYENGEVVFPTLDVWALGDPEAEDLGWYFLTAMNVFGAPTPTISGSFLENLVYGAFNKGEENKNYTDVTLRVTETSVTILDPLRALYDVLGYEEHQSPELVLDITDPDDVKFALTSTSLGYSYFNEGWYCAQYPEDGALDPALACKLTKDGDNVTIKFPFHSTTLFKSPNFYYGSLYESVLKYTQPSDVNAIDNIAVEENNGAAVYYNLQGVRVENPRNGVVIRVQNGKATKMLVK